MKTSHFCRRQRRLNSANFLRVALGEPLLGCPSRTENTRTGLLTRTIRLSFRASTVSAESALSVANVFVTIKERYDPSMTRAKIAISLPKDQLARVHREVRAGRADSVSGYIARVLAEHERRESLRELVGDLIEQHGKPAAEDVKWAERALALRRG